MLSCPVAASLASVTLSRSLAPASVCGARSRSDRREAIGRSEFPRPVSDRPAGREEEDPPCSSELRSRADWAYAFGVEGSPRSHCMAFAESSINAPYFGLAARREESRKIRTDIQALRGLAVLLVLLFHARFGVSGGYLGVDVFFVISGFLMTRLIVAGLDRGDFTFSAFYFRRAKRLLPASYATFFATAVLAPFFLSHSTLVGFSKEMAGAVTYTANMVLWRQTGYFGGAAQLKPLLHVWSLSLEEQYYFLLPATLVFVPRRHWMKAATSLLLLSVVACAIATVRSPGAAFYWLPFRAWELGLGSLLSLLVRLDAERVRRFARPLVWPAILTLVAIPVHPLSDLQPGPDALLVCLATLAIIACDRAEIWRNPAAKALSTIGDASYSLYLVHWPILAFAANAWVGPNDGMPFALRASCVALAIGLGFASYRFVELPVRQSAVRASAHLLIGLAAASMALIAIPTFSARLGRGHLDYAAMVQPSYGFGAECSFGETLRPGPPCQSGETPRILVWGDSFAMMLVSGIDATSHGAGVVQATKAVCGPFLGVAPVFREAGTRWNHAWAIGCLSFNHSVIDYLRTHPSIETVVLSSQFGADVDGAGTSIILGDDAPLLPASSAATLEGLGRAVNAARALGKRVILVAPPPSNGDEVALCLERKAEGKVRIGGSEDCTILLRTYHASQAVISGVIDGAERQFDLPVFRFDPFLCDANRCATKIDSTILYQDHGHLSRDGARLIAQRTSLSDSLLKRAR